MKLYTGDLLQNLEKIQKIDEWDTAIAHFRRLDFPIKSFDELFEFAKSGHKKKNRNKKSSILAKIAILREYSNYVSFTEVKNWIRVAKKDSNLNKYLEGAIVSFINNLKKSQSSYEELKSMMEHLSNPINDSLFLALCRLFEEEVTFEDCLNFCSTGKGDLVKAAKKIMFGNSHQEMNDREIKENDSDDELFEILTIYLYGQIHNPYETKDEKRVNISLYLQLIAHYYKLMISWQRETQDGKIILDESDHQVIAFEEKIDFEIDRKNRLRNRYLKSKKISLVGIDLPSRKEVAFDLIIEHLYHDIYGEDQKIDFSKEFSKGIDLNLFIYILEKYFEVSIETFPFRIREAQLVKLN